MKGATLHRRHARQRSPPSPPLPIRPRCRCGCSCRGSPIARQGSDVGLPAGVPVLTGGVGVLSAERGDVGWKVPGGFCLVFLSTVSALLRVLSASVLGSGFDPAERAFAAAVGDLDFCLVETLSLWFCSHMDVCDEAVSQFCVFPTRKRCLYPER